LAILSWTVATNVMAQTDDAKKALHEAPRRGWVIVDMKKDWNRIYPGMAK